MSLNNILLYCRNRATFTVVGKFRLLHIAAKLNSLARFCYNREVT